MAAGVEMRRTVEQIKRAAFIGWRGERMMVLSPEEARVFLVTSSLEGCLTHLVRYVTNYNGSSNLSFHTQCNQLIHRGRVVDPAEEMFGCARCIEQAEKHQEPTFNLIPTTGCEVSGGKRKGRQKWPSSASS